ncbi:MAG: hypothetical protein CENE_02136 [Candidatus Celerinatantimonas neptuna]|nr:MAG: hypothetical protein CENE_02136 [Candidatus Celerinatantimonas neptuna]
MNSFFLKQPSVFRSPVFFIGGLAIVIAGGLGFWSRHQMSHLADIKLAQTNSSIPLLEPLPQLEVKKVDLIALREIQLAQAVPYKKHQRQQEKTPGFKNKSSELAEHVLKNKVELAVKTLPLSKSISKVHTNSVIPTKGTTLSQHQLPPLLSALPVKETANLPAFTYSAHVYSTDPKNSYIQLNNQILYQGGSYMGLTVVHIGYSDTVFRFHGQLVRQPALKDWQ